MITRLADLATDEAAIRAGAVDFADRCGFRYILMQGMTDQEIGDRAMEVLASPAVTAIVAEHEGAVVAGIAVAMVPSMWNQGLLLVEELFFWAAKDAPNTAALRVLRDATARTKNLTVTSAVLFKAMASSPAKLRDVYRGMGLVELETAFVGVT